MTPFLSMIMPYGFTWAVRGWGLCTGQYLDISYNSALFSLLGSQYGGDWRTVFALPDLRVRSPIGTGRFPGFVTDYRWAQRGGYPSVTLTTSEMPAHQHPAVTTMVAGDVVDLALVASGDAVSTGDPKGAYLTTVGGDFYTTTPPSFPTAPRMATTKREVDMTVDPGIQHTGGGGELPIMSPYLAINYQIALEGEYPPRN